MSVGFATMASVAAVRVAIGGEGTAVRIVTLPDETSTRWINRLIHERDLGLFGQEAAFLSRTAINGREHRGLPAALSEAYDAIAAAGGTSSSPVAATYLFLQRPSAFDAVIVDAPQPNPEAAVIYLHGFGGNLTVQGWLVAQGAKQINAVTVAPSVRFIGDWWAPGGLETIRATIAYLRKQGIRRIYLAGLSNGGIGICRLAPRLKHDVDGLILISGADGHAPDAGLPVLALHGTYDDRISFTAAKSYVDQAGDRGTYREFDGDHLVLAKQPIEMQTALAEWLREQERRAAAR
jgi:predicted esterase